MYVYMYIYTNQQKITCDSRSEAPSNSNDVLCKSPGMAEAPTVKSKKDMKNFSANREDMPPQARAEGFHHHHPGKTCFLGANKSG